MKASGIRELSSAELKQRLNDLKQELFNLRFQHETGQLENPRKLTQTRKDIARIFTIMTEAAKKLEDRDN
ncbi:MAG: 50S ribosomal protein L29 [Desulfobacteraceae bacterium]|nr:50S ribosomal protein L29 [Desulfobacteraceae bacterium]